MAYADELGVFEPIKAHDFRLFITSTGQGSALDFDDFSLAVISAGLPKESSENIEIPAGSEILYYAGRARYENISVRTRDYVDAAVAAALIDWRKRVFDPETGITGYKSEYAGTGILQLYDPKNVVIREWTLLRMWPQNVDHGEGAQDNTASVEMTTTFVIDKAVPTVY